MSYVWDLSAAAISPCLCCSGMKVCCSHRDPAMSSWMMALIVFCFAMLFWLSHSSATETLRSVVTFMSIGFERIIDNATCRGMLFFCFAVFFCFRMLWGPSELWQISVSAFRCLPLRAIREQRKIIWNLTGGAVEIENPDTLQDAPHFLEILPPKRYGRWYWLCGWLCCSPSRPRRKKRHQRKEIGAGSSSSQQ